MATMNTAPTDFTIQIMQALAAGELDAPEWSNQDDACDCVYQRIGLWKNPYLATTHEIRLCCVWAKLGEQYPEFVRDLPGYNYEGEWQTELREWDGEGQMPRAIWYRQLAIKEGRSLSEIRAEYASQEPPENPVTDCHPPVATQATLNPVQLAAMRQVQSEAQQHTASMWWLICEQLGLDRDLIYDLDINTGEVKL